MDGTVGEIKMFGSNFAPRSWAFCQGQSLTINQYSPLFNIIGLKYGGNGATTFQLPDYRGRAAIGAGDRYSQAQKLGCQQYTLSTRNLPAHSHSITITTKSIYDSSPPFDDIDPMEIYLNAQSGRATLTNKVENNYPAKPSGALNIYGIDGNSSMAPTPVTLYNSGIETGSTGTGQAFSIMQPSLAINYIICLTGAFPSRN